MAPCKFAEKVWNAQEAGAQGVRNLPGLLQQTCHVYPFRLGCSEAYTLPASFTSLLPWYEQAL